MNTRAAQVNIFARNFMAMAVVFAFFIAGMTSANAAKRVALVIGNSNYTSSGVLANPRNDAEAITLKLKNLGFEVIGGFDLDYQNMRRKIREFSKKLGSADVSLLFYAGHGMQVNGINYLIPTDTILESEGDIDFTTIPLRLIQRQMERETDTVLVFLDACRNNPVARNLKVAGRSISSAGLTSGEINAKGTLLAFATDPDAVALDGEGVNSPFTTALLKHIDSPNVEVQTMLTDVRVEVESVTKGKQTPWVNSSLLGRFYFNKQKPKQVASLGSDAVKLGSLSAPTRISQGGENSEPRTVVESTQITTMKMEKLAWEAVRQSDDPDELRYFIQKNGDSFFGGMAKMKLKKLEEKQAAKSVEVASLQPSRTETLPPLRDNYRPRELTKLIQEELNRIGCNAGRPDGSWGRNSDNALYRFSDHASVQLASTRPSVELLQQLRSQNAGVCPVSCTAKQDLINGQCIQKSCAAGETLSKKGICYIANRTARSGAGPGKFLKGGKRLSKNQKQNLVGGAILLFGACKALGKC